MAQTAQSPPQAVPQVSSTEALILEVLAGGVERYGLEMVEASGGALKRGTIYVTLERLAQKGCVQSRRQPRPAGNVGIALRLYRLTDLGARALDARRRIVAILADA